MDIIKEAESLIGRGFSVFPLHGITPEGKCTCRNENCTSPGKHPATPQGVKNATKNMDIFKLYVGGRQYLNLGIATGEVSGIFVVDVDGVEGESSLIELEKKHGQLAETLTTLTGRGRHLFFKHPENKKIKNQTSQMGEKLDIRGDGGYVVAPPSKHFNGSLYKFEERAVCDSPDWLVALICTEKKATAPIIEHERNPLDRWSDEDVRDMLSYISPDIGHEEWVQVGMALHEGGYSLAMWDEWSRGSATKYDGSTVPRWRSFKAGGGVTMGSLVHMAQMMGWKPKSHETVTDYKDHPAFEYLFKVGALDKDGKILPPNENKNEPKMVILDDKQRVISSDNVNAMELPGLVGETVRWIVKSTTLRQPELAMINTLAALGAVLGRRYKSPEDTRTNLCMIGIAGSGAGKDASRKMIPKLMKLAGLQRYVGPSQMRSAQGIIQTLYDQPSCIMHVDEFGMVMSGISSDRADNFYKMIVTTIMEMYSTSSGTYIGGKLGGQKSKDQIIIENPCLCIYGTTTLESYIPCLKKSAISNGQLNRMIIYPVKNSVPDPEKRELSSIPKVVLDGWSALLPENLPGAGNMDPHENAQIAPEAKLVTWDSVEAQLWEMFHRQQKRVRESVDTTGLLWSRYRENVIKIAMIFAIVRNPIAPAINDEDLHIARAIVETSIGYVSELARDHFYESQFEKDKKYLTEIIKQKKGYIGKTELIRAAQKFKSKEIDEIVKSLVDAGRLEIVAEKSKLGRPGIAFRLID